ncbi:GNAT family N-acetyltransferase [Actinacidiphila acididurans]|uniref:GNAT family N-acetyltransferase n=1 Tax=Actinacidiphila acididurans TaxID=2784346 RepID=A0ABS2TPN8_9ACTN|nr:GNAT family N-acetyltransferase [Actinacidiphila acididurans]MBM9505299.1 GNAT family N-acetyltransferase [Actinacidiphila acididurans]
MTDVAIRPAQPGELRVVEDLLREASAWLASRGIDQWQFPPHRDRITQALRRGEVFLATTDGLPMATLQLDDHADPEFWTTEDKPGDALYVHRMAVSRKFAGSGVGGTLLNWALERAATAGKPWLRLDAWKDNHGLHRYYESQGFTLVRVIDLPHRGSGALFQRPTVR